MRLFYLGLSLLLSACGSVSSEMQPVTPKEHIISEHQGTTSIASFSRKNHSFTQSMAQLKLFVPQTTTGNATALKAKFNTTSGYYHYAFPTGDTHFGLWKSGDPAPSLVAQVDIALIEKITLYGTFVQRSKLGEHFIRVTTTLGNPKVPLILDHVDGTIYKLSGDIIIEVLNETLLQTVTMVYQVSDLDIHASGNTALYPSGRFTFEVNNLKGAILCDSSSTAEIHYDTGSKRIFSLSSGLEI